MRRLKRRQVELADELDRRLRRAAKNAAAVVIANAADRRVINNAKHRAAIYAAMQREFAEAAAKGQEALNKAIEAVAYGSHTLAVDDIKSRPGKVVVGNWAQFNAKRVERYLELISPENGQDLFAVSFGKMASESVHKMRSAFIDVYRQGQVEGWTLQKTAKNMQQAWDGIAGDLGSYRFTDIAGRAWSNADYLNMVARTTLARTHRESYMDTLTEYGDDLVRIKNTGENCRICDAWDGLIISISGKDERYPSYTAARAGGMFHPNCDCHTVGIVEALDGDEMTRQADQDNVKWTDTEEVQRYNDEVKVKEKVAGGLTREQADIDLKRDKLKHRMQVALLEEHKGLVDQIPNSVLAEIPQDKLPRFEFSKKGDKTEYWSTKSERGGVIHVPREGADPELIMAEFRRINGLESVERRRDAGAGSDTDEASFRDKIIKATDKIVNEPYEKFIPLNSDGSERFPPYKSGPRGGSLPSNWLGNLEGVDFVHNHPSGLRADRKGFGTSFSKDDIFTAARQNMASISAGSKSRVYIMRPGANGWPSISVLRQEFRKNDAMVKNQLMPKVIGGHITADQASIMHNDLVWKKVAKNTGMVYSVIRRTV